MAFQGSLVLFCDVSPPLGKDNTPCPGSLVQLVLDYLGIVVGSLFSWVWSYLVAQMGLCLSLFPLLFYWLLFIVPLTFCCVGLCCLFLSGLLPSSLSFLCSLVIPFVLGDLPFLASSLPILWKFLSLGSG